MISNEDKQYLYSPEYSLALEKYYDPDRFSERDWEAVMNLREDIIDSNGTVDQAYPYTNEKLGEMFEKLDKKSSRVLTVGSSGDQLLNAIFHGAKDLTLIDANLYARYWTEYKIAGIKNFSFANFKFYFLSRSPLLNRTNMFHPNVYQAIFQDLSPDAQAFFGTLILNGETPSNMYKAILGRDDFKIADLDSKFYKDEESYKKLQKILHRGNYKVNFITAKFSDFADEVDGKFDLILLSNICKYVNADEYVDVVNSLYDDHLKSGGKIQLHYDYRNMTKIQSPYYRGAFPDKKIVGMPLAGYHFTYMMEKPSNNQKQSNNSLQEEKEL